MANQERNDKEASFDDDGLEKLTQHVKNLLDIRDRTYGIPPKTYAMCFVGSEAIETSIREEIASDEADALRIGNMMLNAGVFHHVLQAHPFENKYLFYRFASDEDHGKVARKTTVDGLGLEQAGIEYDARMGVGVNDRLRTSNPDIYAVGDVASRYQFTHMADFGARLVIRNALFFGRDAFSKLLIPWATYTDPEVAHVGLYENDLNDRNIAFSTFTREFADVDRGIVDGETDGFVKVHVKKGTDQILGATIVGSHAGDMISEITVAMQGGMGLGKLANVIHPYPTMAEAIRHCGDAYNRARLTPTVKGLFHRLMAFKR